MHQGVCCLCWLCWHRWQHGWRSPRLLSVHFFTSRQCCFLVCKMTRNHLLSIDYRKRIYSSYLRCQRSPLASILPFPTFWHYTLFSDNQSEAIALTKDHQYHARTKQKTTSGSILSVGSSKMAHCDSFIVPPTKWCHIQVVDDRADTVFLCHACRRHCQPPMHDPAYKSPSNPSSGDR